MSAIGWIGGARMKLDVYENLLRMCPFGKAAQEPEPARKEAGVNPLHHARNHCC
jgi:hypothetical protein